MTEWSTESALCVENPSLFRISKSCRQERWSVGHLCPYPKDVCEGGPEGHLSVSNILRRSGTSLTWEWSPVQYLPSSRLCSTGCIATAAFRCNASKVPRLVTWLLNNWLWLKAQNGNGPVAAWGIFSLLSSNVFFGEKSTVSDCATGFNFPQ